VGDNVAGFLLAEFGWKYEVVYQDLPELREYE
jgi:hypothetical protein